MSRKQPKGKVDLKAFLQGHVPDGHLPKGPREMSEEEKYQADQRRLERYGGGGDGGGFGGGDGGERGSLRTGGPGGFGDRPLGGADTEDTWGRAPRAVPTGGGGADAAPQSFAAEEDNDWRSSRIAPAGGAGGGDGPIRASGGDDDDNWRGGARAAPVDGGPLAGGPRPDTDDNWRGSAGRPGPEATIADGPNAKSSNNDSDWRRTAAETVQEVGAGPDHAAVKRSDDDGDWRKTAAETETVVAEPRTSTVAAAEADDDWRKTAKETQVDDGQSVNSGSVAVAAGGALDDSDWRKSRAELSGPTQEEILAAKKEVQEREEELNSDWRGKAAPVLAAAAAAPVTPPAEAVSDWRKGRATATPAAPAGPAGGNRRFGGAGAGDGGNWRRGGAAQQESAPAKSASGETADKEQASEKPEQAAAASVVTTTPAAADKQEQQGDEAEVAAASTPASGASTAARGARGGDKWDKMFARGSPSSAASADNGRFSGLRRFGDTSRDADRMKAFSRFSGAGSSNNSSSGGVMPRNNETTFKAFGAGRREQRAEQERLEREKREEAERKEQERLAKIEKERENRERSFAAFGGGPRRLGGDVPQQQQQQQQQQPQKREMPAAFRQMQSERAPRESEQERMANRERAFAAFGGPQRREDGGDKRGGAAFGGAAGGSMAEAFGSGSGGGARPSRSMLPKLGGGGGRTANWGDDDDGDDDGGAKKHSMTEEELTAKLDAQAQKLIDNFLLSEDKNALVAGVREMKAPNTYMASFVQRTATKALEAELGLKQIKLVAQMISVLVKEKLVSDAHVKEGLEALCALVAEKKSPYEDVDDSEGGVLSNLLKLGSALKDRKALKSEVNDTANALLFDVVSEATKAARVESSGDKVAKLVSSGLKGKELVAAGGYEGATGAALLTHILQDEARLTDINVVWAEAKEYGALLAKLLFFESPSKAELQLGVDALYAVQRRLHEINFPKVDVKGKKVSLIEKIFMKLYQVDVVGEEAVLAWKDDVNDDVPGKMTAIVQTSAFCTWLEAEDESEEESDQ